MPWDEQIYPDLSFALCFLHLKCTQFMKIFSLCRRQKSQTLVLIIISKLNTYVNQQVFCCLGFTAENQSVFSKWERPMWKKLYRTGKLSSCAPCLFVPQALIGCVLHATCRALREDIVVFSFLRNFQSRKQVQV